MVDILFGGNLTIQKNFLFILLLFFVVLLYNIIKLSIELISEQPVIKQQLVRRKFLDYELKNKKTAGFFKKYDTNMTSFYKTHIAPNFKLISNYKFKKLERRLEISGLDSLFSPVTYLLTKYLLTAGGVVLIFIAISLMIRFGFNVFVFIFGFVGGGSIFFLPNVEKRAVNEYNSALLLDFSKFIRFMAGYLTAGKSFREALMATKTYLNPEWDDLLSELLKLMPREGRSAALKQLLTKINIDEISGFFTLLIGSKGGDFRDDFEAEAEAVDDLLQREYLKIREARGTILSLAKMGLIFIAALILMVPLVYEIYTMYTEIR